MNELTACAGCGRDLRVLFESSALSLRCPHCSARVSVTAPATPRPAFWGRWRLLGASLALVLVLTAAAGAFWLIPRPDAPSTRPSAPGNLTPGVDNLKAMAMPGAPAAMPGMGGGMRGMGLGGDQPPPPRSMRPVLVVPETSDANLVELADRGPALEQAGRLEPFLALAGDPATGLFFTSDGDGNLRWYSPALQLRGRCRLPHPAYSLALDAAAGRLYAASSRSESISISRLGERDQASGDLCVYEVADLLTGKSKPEALRPLHTFALDALVGGMQLSDDGKRLAYLSESSRETQVVRIDTQALSKTASRPCKRGAPHALVEIDGVLLGLSGGDLFLIDPDTWQLTTLLAVGSAIKGLTPGGPGRAFLLEKRTNGAYLMLVDLKQRAVVARLAAPMQGRHSFQLGPGNRFYLGTSGVLDGRALAFELTDAERGWAVPRGRAGRDGRRVLRGELHLTPDGRHLVTGNGYAFRTGGDSAE